MRFRVTMKDPDVLHDSINEALDKTMPPQLSRDEWEQIRESRAEDIKDVTNKWFEYGEYLTVEIDTEAQTCVVVPESGVKD